MLDFKGLTLILLTWTIWRAPTNASKWRMGFNSAFKGLKKVMESRTVVTLCINSLHVVQIATNSYKEALHEILKIFINSGHKYLFFLLNSKQGLFF